MSGGAETVRVIVRCRPMNQREKTLNCKVTAEIYGDVGQVQLHKPKSSENPKKFTFDGAFGMESNSKMIYEEFGFPLIESVSAVTQTDGVDHCIVGPLLCAPFRSP